jgi:signal transduction histidine kinase
MPRARDEGQVLQADLLPVSIALAAGLMLSVLLFALVRGYYQSLDRQEFQRDAATYATAFKSSVERHVSSLAAIQAFVSASRRVTRGEFSAFVHQTLPRNSGFEAVLWVAHVPPSGRAAYEAQMARDGLHGLKIHPLSGKYAPAGAGARVSYLPVGYVEPFDGNANLVGLDLSGDPSISRLLATARRTGHVAASAPVTQTPFAGAHGAVVLIALPFDQTSPAREPAKAPSAMRGYALGVLELARVVADLADQRGQHLQAAVAYRSDPRVPPVVLADDGPLSVDRWFGTDVFHQAIPFDIAGQHFILALRSAGHGDHLGSLYAPLGAALLALAFTALLVQNMLTTILRKRSVERAVVTRTAELHDLNRTLSAEVEQRRQAEAGLRVARDRAENANRAKSAFLATMSHELRTPLNAIIGFSGLLVGDPDKFDDQSADYLQEIHGSGIRLLDLINDILDLIQMDSGDATLSSEPIFVGDCIANVIGKMLPEAERAGISLTSVVSENLPLVRGDGRRLQKALRHLVANAIKFTGSGGKARVAACLNPDHTLSVEVRDNGPGMPPEARARILEAFAQYDSRLARNHEGIGLGLTFVHRVAELHGAVLHISSNPGEGTCVVMTFPEYRFAQAAGVA